MKMLLQDYLRVSTIEKEDMLYDARDLEKCIRKIDELRKVKLYMEANGEFFKAEYGYLEKIQEGAAQNLHDISKRAHTDD